MLEDGLSVGCLDSMWTVGCLDSMWAEIQAQRNTGSKEPLNLNQPTDQLSP